MAKYRNEDWLREQVINKNISRVKIANDLSVSHKTIMKYCKRFNIGKDIQECPNCEHASPQLGKHWSGDKCRYPELTKHQKDVLTGLLMSDGSINHPNGNQNARFRVDMYEPSKPYLEYLSEEVFPVITTQVREGETAKHSANRRSNTFDMTEQNCSDMYYLSSRRMPCFNEYLNWYNDGHKYWPCEDIQINSTIFKHLYVGDGSVYVKDGTPYISIACNDQKPVIDKVIKMFDGWVGKPTVVEGNRNGDRENDTKISFNKDQTRRIFERMDEPVPGFQYKWPEYC